MNNLKKDRGYSLHAIVIMIMKRFDLTGKDIFNFLTNVYYNLPTYVKKMNDEK